MEINCSGQDCLSVKSLRPERDNEPAQSFPVAYTAVHSGVSKILAAC